MITALYQSMNNMGEGVRLHEDVEIDYDHAMGFMSYQIMFTDNLDKGELQRRIDRISALFENRKVHITALITVPRRQPAGAAWLS